jgi:PAS domain S-box-containing protein
MNAYLIGLSVDVLAQLQPLVESAGFSPVSWDKPDSVTCDRLELPAFVILPDQGDGPAACRRIRTGVGAKRCVIWCTADIADSRSLQAIRQAGADDCILQSWDSEQISMRLSAAARQIALMEEADQMAAALRQSAERWSLAQRGARAGVWDSSPIGYSLDSPDLPVWYSPEMKQLMGFTDEEFPNVLGSWISRIHPDEVQSLLQRIIESLQTTSEFEIEYRLRHKSGEYMWINGRGQAILDSLGQMIRIAGSIRDITENRRVAEALQASEAKWRSLVEHAPDIITVVEPDGTIQFMNRGWPGLTDADSVGKNLISLSPPESRDAVRAALQSVVHTGRSSRFQLTLRGFGDEPAWYASRVGPVYRSDGIGALLVISTDITTRVHHEDEIRHEREFLRKLLDLGERDRKLIAYEIHDGLAQEMAGALMHLQAFEHMTSDKELGQEFQRGLKLVGKAVQETRRLISGLRPPVLDELGIVAAIEYLINEFQADIPEIEFIHETKFTRLAAPLESAIFRIVQEALNNILTHSGSRRARIEFIERGQRLHLSVRDWGKGFDAASVSQSRFGLQGIQQRGRLLGAQVTIDSRPGHGTTIELDFPLILDRAAEEAEHGAADHGGAER